jgi:hypothetical protein
MEGFGIPEILEDESMNFPINDYVICEKEARLSITNLSDFVEKMKKNGEIARLSCA